MIVILQIKAIIYDFINNFNISYFIANLANIHLEH